ncbi:hypothetical protein [Actinomadura atramentaria]|uniref:hypothetical protein n=1 Tax=Actinomadura atramentaria TaxID=1990 RepID=UPI000381FABA|nr:hypothetical protein [Actinomadura atramentaria]
MRIKFRFIAVWTCVTAAGMAISWAGVGNAIRGTGLSALDLAAEAPGVQGGAAVAPSATVPVTSPSARTPPPVRTSPTATRAPRERRTHAPTRPAEDLRTYTVKSGRVVLAFNSRTARYVSATPNGNFEVKVWRQSTWLRVDITDGTHGSAVFATWNGHPPIAETYEY